MATQIMATHEAGDGYPEFTATGTIEEVIVAVLDALVPIYRIHVPEWFDETQSIDLATWFTGGEFRIQKLVECAKGKGWMAVSESATETILWNPNQGRVVRVALERGIQEFDATDTLDENGWLDWNMPSFKTHLQTFGVTLP